MFVDGISPPLGLKRIKKIKVRKKRPGLKAIGRFALIFILLGMASGVGIAQTKLANAGKLLLAIPDGRYLILLQNDRELRPTGGFIGTIAEAEITNRKLISINFDTNIYKRDDYYAPQINLKAPEPLQSFLDADKKESHHYWGLRDSNWSPDFPSAARQAQWFYEREGGNPTVGVIAVNAQAVADLLKLTGPVYDNENEKVIDYNNFYDIIQTSIEIDYFKDPENLKIDEPKSILKNILPQLEQKAKQLNLFQLQQFATDQLSRKNILLSFNDAETMSIADSQNWTGRVRDSENDFLLISNANLGGQKTSQYVSQAIDYETTSKESNLKITRVYGKPGADQLAGMNKNYLRVLVPLGSVVTNATFNGTDISSQLILRDELGLLSIGSWFNLEPESSGVLEIKYRNPSVGKSNYQLKVVKQSGSANEILRAIAHNKILFNGEFKTDLSLKPRLF